MEEKEKKEEITLQNSCLPCVFFYLKRMKLNAFQKDVLVPCCRKFGIVKLTERKTCIHFVPDQDLIKSIEADNPQETLQRLLNIRIKMACEPELPHM